MTGSTRTGDKGTLHERGPASEDSEAPAGPTLDTGDGVAAAPEQDSSDLHTAPVGDASVEHLVGGSVSVAARNDRLILLWARPAPGFAMTVDFTSEVALTVVFRSVRHQSDLIALWREPELVLRASEEAL